MYEYTTACFVLTAQKHGAPLVEVDEAIETWQDNGWEFVQLSSSATTGGLVVVLVVRRRKE